MSVGHKNVLVVGDVADVNEHIQDTLGRDGYDSRAVATERACLEAIVRGQTALVFISLFSSLDVARLLAQIRAFDGKLPVVLVADAGTAVQVAGLLRDGANDYLLYPIADPSLLQLAVSRNIERRSVTRRPDLNRVNKALVESLEVLERDQRAGLRVQQGMLPDSPFSVGALRLQHRMEPSLILSGDFIDYFELPDGQLLFYIADVSGHGTSGAIVTVLLKSLSTRLFDEFADLGLEGAGEVLGWINRSLLVCGLPQHVTMFLGMIDKAGHALQYANAAHFPGAILSDGNSTRYLELGGLPLGIYDTAEYPVHHLTMPDAFEMVMFSDGVFEILPEMSLHEKEQKLLSLVQCGSGDIAVLADQLGLGDVKDAPDDITVLTVVKTG